MSDRPLISLVTPTIPERRDLLMACIEDVRRQDYPNLEHVIVSEGDGVDGWPLSSIVHDQHMRWTGTGLEWMDAGRSPRRPALRIFDLGRHWSSLLPVESLGVAPILTGLLLARGAYLAWLCDDERFTDPSALSVLADHLEITEADFVYPKVRMWRNGSSPERGWDIGTDPPEYGQFTWCLFKADLLARAMPRFHGPTFNDADLMQRWLAAGAHHAFVGRVLLTHRADR